MINGILRRFSQLTRYYPNVEKFVLERKKPIIVSLTVFFWVLLDLRFGIGFRVFGFIVHIGQIKTG